LELVVGILPSVTYPSPEEWPQTQIKTVTNITQARKAVVTSVAHGFDASFLGVTSLTFKQINGMLQMNGMTAQLDSIIDANNFTVNVDSTYFYPYAGSGVAIVDTGIPAIEQSGSQFFNTPWQNTFI
jgi:hypothetical protein